MTNEKEWEDTLQETNISPKNGILKMIFLFPRWDMLIPWRIRVLAMLPPFTPKQFRSLGLQDWEKLSEGERHFVKCLGQVFFGVVTYHTSHIYITHFTSTTTCWIHAAMIILDFNSHVNDVLFMGGSCLEGSGHKLGVFSIAWDLRDPAASSTFRLIWFLKMTVEAGNCFMWATVRIKGK